MSTRETSVFVPGLLELMGYGTISRTEVEPYAQLVRRNALRPFSGLYPPLGSLALRVAQPINDEPINVNILLPHHYAGLCRPPGEIAHRQNF